MSSHSFDTALDMAQVHTMFALTPSVLDLIPHFGTPAAVVSNRYGTRPEFARMIAAFGIHTWPSTMNEMIPILQVCAKEPPKREILEIYSRLFAAVVSPRIGQQYPGNRLNDLAVLAKAAKDRTTIDRLVSKMGCSIDEAAKRMLLSVQDLQECCRRLQVEWISEPTPLITVIQRVAKLPPFARQKAIYNRLMTSFTSNRIYPGDIRADLVEIRELEADSYPIKPMLIKTLGSDIMNEHGLVISITRGGRTFSIWQVLAVACDPLTIAAQKLYIEQKQMQHVRRSFGICAHSTSMQYGMLRTLGSMQTTDRIDQLIVRLIRSVIVDERIRPSDRTEYASITRGVLGKRKRSPDRIREIKIRAAPMTPVKQLTRFERPGYVPTCPPSPM